MKATVVPAQVTTVEDRITGNLSVAQVALFAIPVFGGSLLYAVLPPSMEVSSYKLIVIACIALVAGISAIRVKGKIVLMWMVILLRYFLRPRIYVFNKNTYAYREQYHEPFLETAQAAPTAELVAATSAKLSAEEIARLYSRLDDPLNRLQFTTTKKGGINVRITDAS